MNFDELKTLLTDMDLNKILPQSDAFAAFVQTVLRLAVMIGPLVMLGFGLLYLFAAPKEANHSLGYRFWWGMASLDAWTFTQKVAGIGLSSLGLVLTVVMSILGSKFPKKELMDAVFLAGKCLLWQLGLILGACLIIDVIVVVCFDRFGFRRPFWDKEQQ
ncbi:MAG: SdpI family protein [Oscillospiraceae bacterium]|nr:SdpI family protein [Oscillospiraceae bacterium]